MAMCHRQRLLSNYSLIIENNKTGGLFFFACCLSIFKIHMGAVSGFLTVTSIY